MVKMLRKVTLFFLALILSVILAACGNDDQGNKQNNTNVGEDAEQEQGKKQESGGHNGHEGMNHSGSGEVPEGLKEAETPKYEVGSKAIITDDHMPGMNGAEATIVGAFDTTVYTVSYTPTAGGEKVTDHKWVIHEEIQNASDSPYKAGDEVVLKADHMEGMKGATATIDSAQQTTVYMVDFIPTTGGEPVKNHKWVTESELSAK
ncbi:YdhK family protein [Bacillus sp. FJAT-27445]|uniref:YdhK family protein n=1 Tax=Bacillus sp. FJAT-27445 TaxID=1679166 RepID=UPI000743C206|nr:YdhK family protein [Bacillus sp. FJAT-27445]